MNSLVNSLSLDLFSIYSMTRARFFASKISRTETLRETSRSRRILSVSLRVRVEFSMALELKTLSESSASSISFKSESFPLRRVSYSTFKILILSLIGFVLVMSIV